MTRPQAITVAATGSTVVLYDGTRPVLIGIPLAADGSRARFIRIQATDYVHVKVGGGHVACTSDDLLVSPYEAVILNVKHFTHVCFLTNIKILTRVNIVPVEV